MKGVIMLFVCLSLLSLCFAGKAQAAEQKTKKLTLSAKSLTLAEGDTAVLKVQAWNGKKKISTVVDWSSSNKSVATIEIVKKKVVRVKAHRAGNAVIKAVAKNGVCVKCKVQVTEKALRLAMVDAEYDINAANLAGCFRGMGIGVDLITDPGKINPALYDGLLIAGGRDVNPSKYGEGYQGAVATSIWKDDLQIHGIKVFAQAGKPILGVCRGVQIINVAFGGTLHQHIGGHVGTGRYVTNVPGTFANRMYGPEIYLVHFHHESIKKLADGFVVVQRDKLDQTIEGIYDPARHIYGFQWHPEISGLTGGMVFNEYLQACRNAR